MTLEFESQLRTDILSEDLKTERDRIIVEAETQYNQIVRSADTYRQRSTTPALAKDITESMELFKEAIEDYHVREHASTEAKVRVSYEDPDEEIALVTITLSLARRDPAAFSQGAPFEGRVKNLKPLLREEIDDPDNPGYKRAILGYWYDNLVRITCWARTNKAPMPEHYGLKM